jgi:tRNA threonylcarbamoyladenosine biosynthesis protein TsaE
VSIEETVQTRCWRSEADTAACARALAAAMRAEPALRDSFIALHGDLGAGKTTFVRYLLRALGVTGRIKSPTYTVVEPHEAGADQAGPRWAAYHLDFYRFNDPREWDDAGLRDLYAAPGLKLAEWPDKAAGHLPAPDLILRIETVDDDFRAVSFQAASPRGRRLLTLMLTPAPDAPSAAASATPS